MVQIILKSYEIQNQMQFKWAYQSLSTHITLNRLSAIEQKTIKNELQRCSIIDIQDQADF